MANEKNNTILSSYKNAVTTAASFAASAMLARTVINEFIPHELQFYLYDIIGGLRSRLSSEHSIVIEQNEGYSSNLIFEAAKTYLSTRMNPASKRLRASLVEEGKAIVISLEAGEEMIDVHQDIEFKWRLICKENENSGNRNTESRWFELRFDKKHKDLALNSYLPHIISSAKKMKEGDRTLQLYMNDMDCWSSINLHHPSTFDTLAMDPKLKRLVMDDLDRFVKRKEYYKRIGKAWKRGYLLYGPPGTGKSSLIAAMANFLKFDIYDLELTEVKWNSNLRRLLVGMSNRSILVIEDIDCSVEIQKRDEPQSSETSTSNTSKDEDKITLSGLLNFVDGLWSTSGEERIIVFTTNYKERLDPALLRPGRMDMHIQMGYCCFQAFKVLVSNYHAIHHHSSFTEIQRLMENVEVTPAEIAEELMKSDDVEVALQGLLLFLKAKQQQI